MPDEATQQLLEALVTHAAVSLGPIATLIVDQAAAGGGGFEDIRRRVASHMDADAGEAFIAATERLAAKANAAKANAAARAAVTPSVPPSAPAAQQAAATLDRSDPGLVRALAGELKARIGPDGQTIVEEAARKCRTTVQFYLRLAAAVSDPDLKAQLSRRAATEAAARSAPRS